MSAHTACLSNRSPQKSGCASTGEAASYLTHRTAPLTGPCLRIHSVPLALSGCPPEADEQLARLIVTAGDHGMLVLLALHAGRAGSSDVNGYIGYTWILPDLT